VQTVSHFLGPLFGNSEISIISNLVPARSKAFIKLSHFLQVYLFLQLFSDPSSFNDRPIPYDRYFDLYIKIYNRDPPPPRTPQPQTPRTPVEVQINVRDANYFFSVFTNLLLQNVNLEQVQSLTVLQNPPKKQEAPHSFKFSKTDRLKAELRLKLKIYKEEAKLYGPFRHSHYPTPLQAHRRTKGVAHELMVLSKIKRRLLGKYQFLKKISLEYGRKEQL